MGGELRSVEVQRVEPPEPSLELVELLWHKGAPWIEDIRRRLLGQAGGAADRFFVARVAGVAAACAWRTTSPRHPHLGLLGHVYTRPEYRRRGLARRLATAAIEDVEAAGGRLIVLFTSAPHTIPFYQKLGFRLAAGRPVYHEMDWAMVRWAEKAAPLADWFRQGDWTVRRLTPADAAAYCLLYNLEHETRLKDWAQSIDSGLEAELTFIHTTSRVEAGGGVCYVLENERLIAGAASLMVCDAPHHRHLAAMGVYAHPLAADRAAELLEACWAERSRLGAEFVYALSTDAGRRRLLERFGFRPLQTLARHVWAEGRRLDAVLLRRRA